MFREIHDVAKIGATKRVNALGVIADYRNVVMRRGDQADDLGLQAVSVLVFIYHDETVDTGKAVAHFFMIGQQVAKPDQEIVVVEQRFRLFIVDVAMVKLGELVVDIDQMRIF